MVLLELGLDLIIGPSTLGESEVACYAGAFVDELVFDFFERLGELQVHAGFDPGETEDPAVDGALDGAVAVGTGPEDPAAAKLADAAA